jgi:hypothetical protein
VATDSNPDPKNHKLLIKPCNPHLESTTAKNNPHLLEEAQKTMKKTETTEIV